VVPNRAPACPPLPQTPQDVYDAIAMRLQPALQSILPASILGVASEIFAGCDQQLGQPPPVVPPDQAAERLAAVLGADLLRKGHDKIDAATPPQAAAIVETGTKLIPVLDKMNLDQLKAALQNPPPQLNAFLEAYLAIGVPDPDQINAALAQSPPPASIAEAVAAATGQVAQPGHSMQLCVNGAEAYRELEDMICTAKDSILIETYTFHEDETGQRMADLLIAKHREGVNVKVMYDSLGQNSSDDRAKTKLAQLAAAGIEVIEYNREVAGPTGVNLSHRKLYIVDGKAAMTGGMNIGNNYRYDWHDTLVRVDGPVVADICKHYAFDWKQAGGDVRALPPAPSPAPVLQGDLSVAVLVSSPREKARAQQIRDGWMAAIDAAKQEIWIENPYFSDAVVNAHLVAALRRGVQVNVILPSGNDEPLFSTLNAIAARQLTDEGAKAFLYDTGPNNINFNHTKMAMVDGRWVMMGSANADARTYEENQELNVAVEDAEFAQTVRARLVVPDSAHGGAYAPPPWPVNQTVLRLAAAFL
jgi:cardiolipin synthase